MIAFNVSRPFPLPELRTSSRDHRPPAAVVHVPETSVDKDHLAPAGEDEVWAAWQPFRVQDVAVAQTMDQPPDNHFRLCVLALDRRHVPAALLRSVNVHQGNFFFTAFTKSSSVTSVSGDFLGYFECRLFGTTRVTFASFISC